MKKIRNKGFSLVELIIVIMIIALLVALVTPSLIKYLEQSRKVRDMHMAQTLGEALERVIATNPDACDEWDTIGAKSTPVYFDVTDPVTGDGYRVINGFEWTLTKKGSITGKYAGNFRNGVLRDPYGKGKHPVLYDAYVDELQSEDINIFYRKYNINQYRILKRADTGDVEVWVCPVKPGTDGEGVTNGFVYYRLWPNPDPGYMAGDPPTPINANGKNNTL